MEKHCELSGKLCNSLASLSIWCAGFLKHSISRSLSCTYKSSAKVIFLPMRCVSQKGF